MKIPANEIHKAAGRHPALLLAAVMVTGSMHAASALAQDPGAYPAKAVRFVVGQSPGGATDIVARSVAQKLSERLGQNFVVENRTGAAGSIGAAFVAKSAPDGYNVLIVSSSYAINPSLYKNLPFDPIKDFAPASLIAEAPFLLVVHPSMPVRSVKDLTALAKSRAGELNFASGGNGSSGHLAGALFNFLAGTEIVHVPYKGAGPALVDVMSGQVHLTFASVLSSLPHVKNRRLRAIAMTGARRSAAVPELPTVAEAGIKGYRRTTWYGALAPAGTPAGIVGKLSAAIRNAVQSPEMKQRFIADGAEPAGSTPGQFHDHLVAEMAAAREIIRKAGVKR